MCAEGAGRCLCKSIFYSVIDWKKYLKTGGKPIVILLRRARRPIKGTTGQSTSPGKVMELIILENISRYMKVSRASPRGNHALPISLTSVMKWLGL